MKTFLLFILIIGGCSSVPKKLSEDELTQEILCTLNEYRDKKCNPIEVDNSKVRKEKNHKKLEASIKKLAGKNSYAFIDLNGDGEEELLVYKNKERGYCGSGGCNLLIYEKKGKEFEKISKFTVVKTPVIVSDTKTNGFRDLIFYQWRYDEFGYYHVARFKEGKYPSNPTILPYLINGYKISGEYLFSGF